MQSSFLYDSHIQEDLDFSVLDNRIAQLINSHSNLLSKYSQSSTRAAGDTIQELIKNNISHLVSDLGYSTSTDHSRRAMADLELSDSINNKYVVDVKTRLITAKFSMPNLVSIKRLANLYKNSNSYFLLMCIEYRIINSQVVTHTVLTVPIEYISWSCLSIGNLGNGQLQLKANKAISLNTSQTRQQWLKRLCNEAGRFYITQKSKCERSIKWFYDYSQSID